MHVVVERLSLGQVLPLEDISLVSGEGTGELSFTDGLDKQSFRNNTIH